MGAQRARETFLVAHVASHGAGVEPQQVAGTQVDEARLGDVFAGLDRDPRAERSSDLEDFVEAPSVRNTSIGVLLALHRPGWSC